MYMYVLHNKEAHNALRAIAMLVVVTLVLWAAGITPFSQKANAANVTSFSDTLSDSGTSAPSNHTIRFTVPNGIYVGQTIVLTFPAGFVAQNGLDFNDFDVASGSTDIALAAAPAGASWGVATTSTTVTFTTSGSVVASSSPIVIKIGTNATSGATGNTQYVNPVAQGSYQIDVTAGVDSGHTQVAIVNDVNVTANVSTTFTFTVSGLATSSMLNGTSTTRTTTATSIPFGTLTAGVIQTAAQRLNVTTNAIQGFAVTVFQDANLLSSTGADIDGFANGTYTNTPAVWTAPTNNIANEATWGHWGLTSEDDEGGNEFSSNKWVAASTTPRTIFTHSGPADGVTPMIGSTTVGYQVQITPLQEAGDDYSTVLTYVATPTF